MTPQMKKIVKVGTALKACGNVRFLTCASQKKNFVMEVGIVVLRTIQMKIIVKTGYVYLDGGSVRHLLSA